MDDTVNVLNPKYIVKIYSNQNLVSEYGSFILIRDDLLQAVYCCLHEHNAKLNNCLVEVYEDNEKILNLRLENEGTKLSAI